MCDVNPRKYFDPIYGHIELKPIIWDLLTKCAELKRLRLIGMMNFRSLDMLPLTTISRLEHTIGLTYLSQVFCENNSLQEIDNDLLVSSLYHDVNCGSFGHAVEWAIDRHIDFKHEEDAKWVQAENTLDQLKEKPIFLEQDGLHQFGFGTKYSLNFRRINSLIDGSNYYFINNSGIDLDNIDNVFRMAHYLGFDFNRSTPLKLARSLVYDKSYDNFLIDHKDSHLIQEWLDTRSSVYQKFIYSDEYMGYEYLIFKLISSHAATLEEKSEVKNIFHYTDERLLWTLYDNKKENPNVAKAAKQLLLHKVPICYGILKSKNFEEKRKLDDNNYLKNIETKINSHLRERGISSSISVHLTTDNRKTNRKIDYYSIEPNKEITKKSIGQDKQYLLMAILGEKQVNHLMRYKILSESNKVLDAEGVQGFKIANTQNTTSPQLTLF